MLEIISGGASADKNKCLFLKIKKAIDDNKEIIIIVPEQFVFEYDKKLYKFLGGKLFNSVTLVSFNKLSLNIIKLFGSEAGEYADENTKQIIMYKAIKSLNKSKKSKYYAKQLEKQAFLANALDLVKDIRQSEVSADILQKASENTSGSLSDKLHDVNYLFKNYCELLKQKDLKDDITTVSQAAVISKNQNFFNGKEIFIDEFDGFLNDQMSMIKVMINQALNVTVSLEIGTGNNKKGKISPFVNTISTENQLVDIAKELNVFVDFNVLKDTDKKPSDIVFLGNNLYYPLQKKVENSQNIKINVANNLYEEIDYVASQITKLVVDKGYKYSEIAVVSRQLKDYFGIIPITFERYDIPFFIDTKQNVSQKALVLYIMSILDSVSGRKFKTENILTYIKSSLSMFNDAEISRIEDYCYQWSVDGDVWLDDFTAIENNDIRKPLEELNLIRRNIIDPLINFKNACKNVKGSEVCKAFYELLNEINLSVIMTDIMKNTSIISSDKEKSIEIVREFKQLWEVLISAIRLIHNHFYDEKLSISEFTSLLKSMLANSKIATPPQKLDTVTVASSERSHLANPKVVFVIGVNEGIMPYNIKDTGLFSDKDKDELEKTGIKISKKTMWKLAQERLIAYKSLTAPTEKLFVSYPLADLAVKIRRPSPIILQMLNIYGKSIEDFVWQKPLSFFCLTPKAMFYKYVECYKEKTVQTESIKKILLNISEYKEKVIALDNFDNVPNHSLNKNTSKSMFFNDDFNISASSVDKYNRCPFNYFCSHGLEIKPIKKIEINPLNRGNIVHACLDSIMTLHNGENKIFNKDFLEYDDDIIRDNIRNFIKYYQKNNLGGDFAKTERFNYLIKNLEELIFDVLKNIQFEINNSKFIPEFFEYQLSNKYKNMYSVDLDNGVKLILKGTIDRVDVFNDDGKKYIRIVDYKTGIKKLDFADLYYGIDLQLILYLMALTQNNEDYIPVGALYMPSSFVKPELSRDLFKSGKEIFESEVFAFKTKKFKKNGVIVRDQNKDVMKDLTNKEFIQIKNRTKADGESDIIPNESYKKLEQFAKDKLNEMVDNLKFGKIEANPVSRDLKMTCEYCDYWSVCGNYKPQNARVITKNDADNLKEIIGIYKEGGKEDAKLDK